MLTIYNHDSPTELAEKGDHKKLRDLMSKLYYGDELDKRIKLLCKETNLQFKSEAEGEE